MKRYENNPIITPADVKPSREDFEVVCVFNCGVTRFHGETLLLMRVAEVPKNDNADVFLAPMLDDKTNELIIKSYDKNDKSIDFADSRFVITPTDRVLTSVSHFRIARSKDGINFEIDEKPAMFPCNKYERFGIEDPRITKIEDTYYINYSACSNITGVTTNLASTKDFKEFTRHGVIFTPDNKDVAIFPEKINGKYLAFNRPASAEYKMRDMWISESDNLVYWGNHKQFMGGTKESWDGGRIGCSAVPFKTEKGWIEIYHAADENDRYCLGALLLDLEDPTKIIARSKGPIIEPEEDYEVFGFYGNVIFNCGVLPEDDGTVKIYYGAADTCIAYAETTVDEILEMML